MKPSKYPNWVYSLFLLNTLEHFLTSLKVAFIPLVPQLFFPQKTYLEGLIILLSIYPIGFLAKPLGGLFFQFLEKRFKLFTLLKISFIGTGLFSVLLGLTPLFFPQSITFMLIVARFFKSFFSSTEVIGISLLLKKNLEDDLRHKATNFIGASSMLGIWSSFVFTSVVQLFNLGKLGFSFAHLMGFFLLLIPFFMTPIPSKNGDEYTTSPKPNLFQFSFIALLAGFSAFCYSCAFILIPATCINQSSPLVSGIMITLDLLLIWYFGKKSIDWGTKKPLFFALGLGVVSPSIFIQMELFGAMTFFILIGTLFSAPLYSYLHEKIPEQKTISYLSWGYLVGSQLFGTLTPIAYLKMQKWVENPILIFWITAFFSLLLILLMLKVEHQEKRAILKSS
jgi:hypothetical protein